MQVRFGRPLLPREHGAWAMLLTPPLVSLLALGPSWSGVQVMLGWFLAYAARGPLEVLLGQGASGRAGMARGEAPVARFWLLVFAGAAALLLLPAVLRRPVLLLPLAGALALALAVAFGFALRAQQRALLSGLLAVTGLMAGAPLYDLAASGQVTPAGWAITYACFAFFGGSVFRVKTMGRERRRSFFHGLSVAVHFAFVAGAILAAALGWVPALLPLALLPPLVWAVVCAWRARQEGAANLNRVGMSEVYLTLLFAPLVVLTVRVPL
jgi:hypothetical protein